MSKAVKRVNPHPHPHAVQHQSHSPSSLPHWIDDDIKKSLNAVFAYTSAGKNHHGMSDNHDNDYNLKIIMIMIL